MSTATTDPPLLEASGLTVRFGKVTALDRLDLVAPPGEVLAILGPNGAGKTTFARTIATLIGPTSGRSAGAWRRCGPRSVDRPTWHRPGRPVRRGRADHDRS